MKITMKDISRYARVSETTVKRVLYSIPGVNYETKKRVLAAAEKLGYERDEKRIDIGVVFPVCPKVFWNEIRSCCEMFEKKSQYGMKMFTYGAVEDSEEFSFCLTRAIEAGASVLIVVAPDSLNAKNAINAISEEILVIILEEYIETDNCYFVGEDSFENGYLLTKKYFEMYPDRSRLITMNASAHNSKKRILGIESALKELKKPEMILLNTFSGDVVYRRLTASMLARALEKYKDSVDCVCLVNSFAYISCMSIGKLKLERDIHCIGFETHPSNKKYIDNGVLKLLCSQNLKRQTELSLEMAEEFLETGKKPAQKCVYVENTFSAAVK